MANGIAPRSIRPCRRHRVANAGLLACFLSSMAPAAAQQIPCPELTPAEYQRFVDITLEDEDNRDARNFVIRWEDEINVEILGTPSAEDRANLQTVIDDISALVPAITFAGDDKATNFFVHYVPIESYGDIISSWGVAPGDLSTACGTFYYWRRGSEIVEVQVLLPTNALANGCGTDSSYLLSLAREEITQALGFPNDVPGERESIFDHVGDPLQYSPTDRRLIQALYCDDVHAGMTEVALWRILVPDHTALADLLGRVAGGDANGEVILEAQMLLTDLGYKFGPIDGAISQGTLAAIAHAQERFGK